MTESRTRPLFRVIQGTGRPESAPIRELELHKTQLVRVDSGNARNRPDRSSPNRYPGGDAA